MQMRRNYEPTDKPTRIRLYRQRAAECSSKGFDGFAAVNVELAELLEAELKQVRKDREKAQESAE